MKNHQYSLTDSIMFSNANRISFHHINGNNYRDRHDKKTVEVNVSVFKEKCYIPPEVESHCDEVR